MKFKSASLSEIGNFRKSNQDFLAAEKNKDGDLFAIVCDGMGGHAHGEIASKLAVQTFISNFKNSKFNNLTNSEINVWLRETTNKTMKVMLSYAEDFPDSLDMGTTLSAILFTNKKGFVINIGDSRTYKFVNEKLFQITKDQNLWNSTADEEKEKINKAANYGNRFNEFTYWKVLTSALGPKKTLKIDTYLIKEPIGLYMLTTDGVHDYIDQESVIEILSSKAKLKSKCTKIVEYAKGDLSTDNLSILLVEVK
ncbi:phosphorylated protein phosphatase [Williamsoniiplasma somnilux]|uniref:Phosphorylated protein phosphatase n=1 Tax=Williamsoniiplasma somnilux TaxID=215578 RepID=A0A2K8NZF5_9MOLU|nr:PP2C family serine/threonine-protein phosphatase [Williamsoniiplasma somnilux]ATZ18598.1 phosphorylated protein phosphatase [Williamsoniiplasma somnilux]